MSNAESEQLCIFSLRGRQWRNTGPHSYW